MANCYNGEYDLRATLRHNLGRVCGIVTDSGAEFTGVLSETNGSSCRLISLNAGRGRCCDNARRVHTIPIDKISCLETSQY